MSRVLLVTGNKGQLGTDLVRILSEDYIVDGFDIDEVDIRDADKVKSVIRSKHPQIVIHTAAYTDVDGCESNVDAAIAVNAEGTENIAKACREIGAKMIYYSTDYVFDGCKGASYTEQDKPHPLTIYGKSKLEGERRVAEIVKDYTIMRIAWVYGAYGRNFVKTMIKLGREQLEKRSRGMEAPPLRVVDDQIGNPTWTVEIAGQTKCIIKNNLTGVFHSTSEGEVSWYGFARLIFRHMAMEVEIVPCTTLDFPRPAPRPAFSALENYRLKEAGLNKMRPFGEALEGFLDKYGEELEV